MKKLNWGVIGLGNIARKFLDGFSGVNNANLLAISSNNSEKLENFKKQFNIDSKFCFDDYEKLLNCKEVDIVYISLPNSLHYHWISKSIENKKKILVEKPATLNFSEAEKISKKIKNQKLFFTEGFMYRYLPQTNFIIEIIKNKEIGKLISMETSFGINLLTKKKFIFFNKKKEINRESRQFNKKLGGGCILDLGCYTTSLSLFVASLINNIDYKNFKLLDIKKKIGDTDVVIDACGKLLFEGGFFSKISSSFQKNLGNKTIINGDRGKIIIENTWLGSENIIKILGRKKYNVNTQIKKNIYSYEIESISKSVLKGLNETIYPGIRMEETLLNMKVLDNWING